LAFICSEDCTRNGDFSQGGELVYYAFLAFTPFDFVTWANWP
jgi:hypothetical protein